MALRCISQTALAATTETTLVDGTQQQPLVLKSVVICNRDAGSDQFRIRLRRGNEAVADKQFLVYDKGIAGYASETLGFEIGLLPGDVLMGYAGLANLSISIFAE